MGVAVEVTLGVCAAPVGVGVDVGVSVDVGGGVRVRVGVGAFVGVGVGNIDMRPGEGALFSTKSFA